MGVLISVLTVFFSILCVLLIILVLMQSNKGAGMGILGGSSQSAFGSTTADVIQKATAVMVFLFMVGSLGLAVLVSTKSSIEKEVLSETKGAQVMETEQAKQNNENSAGSTPTNVNK